MFREQVASLERIQQQFPNEPVPQIEKQVWFAADEMMAVVSHESMFRELVAGGFDRMIDDVDAMGIWGYLAKEANPGSFLFVRKAGIFRALFHGMKSWHAGRRVFFSRYGQKQLETSGQEGTYWYAWASRLVEQEEEAWSYERFEKSFGSAGLGVFETPTGIRIRLVQFKERGPRAKPR